MNKLLIDDEKKIKLNEKYLKNQANTSTGSIEKSSISSTGSYTKEKKNTYQENSTIKEEIKVNSSIENYNTTESRLEKTETCLSKDLECRVYSKIKGINKLYKKS
ncbi:MAG: hypothetical protein U9Q66_02490 [Patescibacteria group bacterium]|nr:hypothetical protein [Patescibacteria group bacterium]